VGNAQVALGDLTGALANRRKSLEILNRLAKADPGNVQAQQSLAISYMHLADLLGNPGTSNMGQRIEALKNYRAAIEILTKLREKDATNSKTTTTIDRINGLLQRIK
jgi:hypothetical protein